MVYLLNEAFGKGNLTGVRVYLSSFASEKKNLHSNEKPYLQICLKFFLFLINNPWIWEMRMNGIWPDERTLVTDDQELYRI
jgi:hypothetical protein